MTVKIQNGYYWLRKNILRAVASQMGATVVYLKF